MEGRLKHKFNLISDSLDVICENNEEIKPEPATCVQHESSQIPCDSSSDKLVLCEKRSQASTKLSATRRAQPGIKRRVNKCLSWSRVL